MENNITRFSIVFLYFQISIFLLDNLIFKKRDKFICNEFFACETLTDIKEKELYASLYYIK